MGKVRNHLDNIGDALERNRDLRERDIAAIMVCCMYTDGHVHITVPDDKIVAVRMAREIADIVNGGILVSRKKKQE